MIYRPSIYQCLLIHKPYVLFVQMLCLLRGGATGVDPLSGWGRRNTRYKLGVHENEVKPSEGEKSTMFLGY